MQKLQHAAFGLLFLLVLMTFLQLMPAWHDTLTYQSQTALSQGWPLLTAHFVHLNWTHALFNYLALLIIVIVWQHQLTARWLINAVVLSGATIGLLLIPFDVQFVGSSGVIHGVLLYCLIKDAQQRKWMWLVVVALLAKVIAELSGWRPAHFIGDDVAYIHAAGLISAAVLLLFERRRIRDAVTEKT